MVAESGVAFPLLITELYPTSAFSTFRICPPIMDQRVTANKWPYWKFLSEALPMPGDTERPTKPSG